MYSTTGAGVAYTAGAGARISQMTLAGTSHEDFHRNVNGAGSLCVRFAAKPHLPCLPNLQGETPTSTSSVQDHNDHKKYGRGSMERVSSVQLTLSSKRSRHDCDVAKNSNADRISALLVAVVMRLACTPFCIIVERLELNICVCRHLVCKPCNNRSFVFTAAATA